MSSYSLPEMMAAFAGGGPGYWMDETSGVARSAVLAYLAGSMSPEQVAAMRAYLRQWIGSPVWDQNPHATDAYREWLANMRVRIDFLTSIAAIRFWIDDATDECLDPL